MELTLGPILFEWKRADVLRFYEEAAAMDIDRVYLGEVVCEKKKGLMLKDIKEVAAMLTEAGKKVVLSSLAVISNESELNMARGLLTLPYALEANDMSVFNMANPAEREVICGPHITSYNVPSLEFLKSLGVKRVCFPVELSAESVRYNIKHTDLEAEVFAWGRMPLAFSWRCYTSRAHGLGKTNCQHNCLEYPDGLMIRTMDGQPLFTINGTSILSASTLSLAGEIEELRGMGVSALRISPQLKGTAEVVKIFRDRLKGELSVAEAEKELRPLSAEGLLSSGWYHGGPGMTPIFAEEGESA
ncbi:MAG: U32 family peptidase [Thermodesulfobacteriota bacterium]